VRRVVAENLQDIQLSRESDPFEQEISMKTSVLPVLFACACGAPLSASAAETAAPKNADDIAVIRQIEKDMGDAMTAVDIDKLGQMFADDWATTCPAGTMATATKESILRDFKSGNDRLEAFELGPIDVQVFGDTAIAQGSSIEKRTRNGKDASGQFVWVDILEKREGKWVVVKGAGGRVKQGTEEPGGSAGPSSRLVLEQRTEAKNEQ
jgi:ketosteroid isomerase-like protein